MFSLNLCNKILNPNFNLYNIFIFKLKLHLFRRKTLSHSNIQIFTTSASNNSEYRVFHSMCRWKRAETVITIFSLPYTSNVRPFFIVNPRKSAVTAINLQSCERPTFIIALACEV